MKKYKLTDNTYEHNGKIFYQIEALKDFSGVKKGELGGFVQSEDNLSQEGNCWIGAYVKVKDNAKVTENAKVDGIVIIKENAKVGGNVNIYGYDFKDDPLVELEGWDVYDKNYSVSDLEISGNSFISGNSVLKGNVQVSGNAIVDGKSVLKDSANVSGNAHVGDNAEITDFAKVEGDVKVVANAHVGDNAHLRDNVIVGGNVNIRNQSSLSGNVAVGGNTTIENAILFGSFNINENIVVENVKLGSDKDFKDYATYKEIEVKQLSGEYIYNSDGNLVKKEEIAKENTLLSVPFEEKDEAKKLGAKWDNTKKSWFAPSGSDLSNFSKWRENNMLQSANEPPHEQFRQALEEKGLIIDGTPIMDGKMQRVSVVGDKRNQKSGAYVGFTDGIGAGYIQNYKTGYKGNWKAKIEKQERQMTPSEHKKFTEMLGKQKKIQENREKEMTALQEKTANYLKNEFDNAKWAYDRHPYLKEKGFSNQNFYLKQDIKGNLLVKLQDTEGKHWATQRIFANGDKTFSVLKTEEQKKNNEQFQSRKSGNFALVGGKSLENENPIVVTEGFATAATMHNATSKTIVAAMDAGNMKNVVGALSKKYPDKSFILAADNDISKELDGNPNVGKNTALEIKDKFKDKVQVALPHFTKDEVKKGLSDFNDLQNSRGLQEVKKQFSISFNSTIEKINTKSKKVENIKVKQQQKKGAGIGA